jgi:hypothetical protein
MNRFLYIKKLWLFSLYFASLLLMGCQEEEYEVLTEEEQQSLSRDSETFDLVMRTSMHDGSIDDEIDNSPCFSLDLPFEVSVNGTKYNINTASELSDFLDSRSRGNIPGTVEFQFPFTVTNANYVQIPVNNAQQFRALQQRCENDIALGEQPVTCAKIQYPVTVFVYDTRSQKTLSQKMNNKEQLFSFLSNIKDNQIFNFSFPIEVELNGNSFEVSNNSQLRNLLKECNRGNI